MIWAALRIGSKSGWTGSSVTRRAATALMNRVSWEVASMSPGVSTGRPLGRSNPLVGRIRRLSRSPEERALAGLMLAEGVHLALEALAEGTRIHEAIVSPRFQRDPRTAHVTSRLLAA